MASGYPDAALQPIALLAKAMRDAARRPGTYGRAPSEGIEPLRSWFASELDRRRVHDVLVTSGGQTALSLIFRSLALPGDIVAMETPTYIGAIAACRASGLTPAAVPTDAGGVRLDDLTAVVEATGARIVYLQPRFHNPTGTSLAADRRPALMALAEERGLIVIEDDWLYDLDDPMARQRPLAADDPNGHVVHVRCSPSRSLPPCAWPAWRPPA
ncbi:MAG: PLP-dependent aminotransferase family protein [Acidimicrobiales bacterium]